MVCYCTCEWFGVVVDWTFVLVGEGKVIRRVVLFDVDLDLSYGSSGNSIFGNGLVGNSVH